MQLVEGLLSKVIVARRIEKTRSLMQGDRVIELELELELEARAFGSHRMNK